MASAAIVLGWLCVAWTARELACLVRAARRPGLLVRFVDAGSAPRTVSVRDGGVAAAAATPSRPPTRLPATPRSAPPPPY